MPSPYHAGEIAVQARAGVRAMAERIGNGIHAVIPPVAAAFVAAQRMAVLAAADREGRVWASLLGGEPGFLHAADERTLRIVAGPAPGGPLHGQVESGAAVGVLAIDLATRRRMRLNGTAEWESGGGALVVRAAEVYSNCPKYIQARDAEEEEDGESGREDGEAGAPRVSDALSEAHRAWVAGADTFFVASRAPGGGADASHRGGRSGFVRVEDPRTLLFPDYAGNSMFNTLGNLAADPACGLLFPDFGRGAALHLSGRAEIVWEGPEVRALPGAERAVRFHVERVVETGEGSAPRLRLREPSPFNP